MWRILTFIIIFTILIPFITHAESKQTKVYPDGSKYVGMFKDGKEHGQGTLTYPNGFKYVGEWKEGMEHGHGTLTVPNGTKYVGEWKDGKQHGYGTLTWIGGEKEGGVNIYVGRSVDYYLRRDDYKKIPLDFEVYCDDFIIERHDPKFRLVTYVKDKDRQEVIPVKAGKRVSIPGHNYAVTVKEYYKDAEYVNESINKSNEPDNPAIYVQMLDHENVIAEGWLLAKDHNWYNDPKRDLKVEYLWANSDEDYEKFAKTDDYSDSNSIRIVQNKKGKQTISYFKDKMLISITDWEINKSYDVDDTGLQIRILKYFPSHSVRSEIVRSSDNHEGHNHAPGEHAGTPAVLVEIEGPRGKVVDWVLANNPPKWYPDKNFALLYEQSGMAVKDYKSALRVVEDGKTVLTKTIGLDDPLKYKGYAFYTSSYDPEGEKYTGLQVIRNPGLYVYVGEFKDDKKHGHGTLTCPNGFKYVGEWKNDMIHGQGTCSSERFTGISMDDLYVNPFVYEGKTVCTVAYFGKMESATSGVFMKGGDSPIPMVVVSDIPKGLFTASDTRVILAGKVLGNIEFKIPLLGPMQVPHLKVVDVCFCK